MAVEEGEGGAAGAWLQRSRGGVLLPSLAGSEKGVVRSSCLISRSTRSAVSASRLCPSTMRNPALSGRGVEAGFLRPKVLAGGRFFWQLLHPCANGPGERS